MTDEPKSRAVNREIADATPLAPVTGAVAVQPENMGQVMEFAKMMATAKVGVPKHLRNEPGVCLRVVLQASRAGLDPYDLATESFVVQDILAYSAKAVHAIVLQSGRLQDRFQLTFTGEGEELTCRIKGHMKGASQPASEIYKLKDITTRNSPLWKTQPRQQLGYFAERAWCRLHAPDAMMGLKTPDDAAWEKTIDVTPGRSEGELAVAERLGIPAPTPLTEEESEAFITHSSTQVPASSGVSNQYRDKILADIAACQSQDELTLLETQIEPRATGIFNMAKIRDAVLAREVELLQVAPEGGDPDLQKIQREQKEQRDLLGGE